MMFRYSGLWNLLLERNMTKTEMRLRAGISTNVLAKMEKGIPVSMESLAKICAALHCSLADIADVSEYNLPNDANAAHYGVSNATLRNWKKLNTSAAGRLTSRANKRRSKERILPMEYISDQRSVLFVQHLLELIDERDLDITSVVLSIGINLLKKGGIYDKRHVADTLCDYSETAVIEELLTAALPENEFDILGLVYQSYLREGKKNTIGSYYTPIEIARNMTKGFDFSCGQRFFDPCCGSGAFLLAVDAATPHQLFGVDNDCIAVLIAKINLLLKYKEIEFIPQIYCLNYLTCQQSPLFGARFDYIATNPPWGAMDRCCPVPDIASKESFSCFFVKAFAQLADFGTIRFLFPEAILNVKAHRDIREFMLDKAGLSRITFYTSMFSGVTTKYVDIECRKDANKDRFVVNAEKTERIVEKKTIYETNNLVFNLMTNDALSIVRAVKSRGKFSLQNSTWALGIVTGDNQKKLFLEHLEGTERIYTGKEICPYVLRAARYYIRYDRSNLQQTAKNEIYRAPEKLVYKFISNKLVFAYDNSGSLFLNSANILIPDIPSLSIKTVLAFLNSSLFQFLYGNLFGETKILKGNLMELPFPEISEVDDARISACVDAVLGGDSRKADVIDNCIFSIYDLSETQIAYIRSNVNGKTH